MADKKAAVEALLPVELGTGKVKFARGIKAGRWVFSTGLMAQDFTSGIAPDVLSERAPHAGRPKREKEATDITVRVRRGRFPRRPVRTGLDLWVLGVLAVGWLA